MIEPPRLQRDDGPSGNRSQLALELILTAYALVSALLVVRLLLKIVHVSSRVWAGSTIDRVTDPILLPLAVLPGSGRQILGAASLADITAVLLLLLVPLWLMARRRYT